MNRIVTSRPWYRTWAVSPSTTLVTSAVRRAARVRLGDRGLGCAVTVFVVMTVVVGAVHAARAHASKTARGKRTFGACHAPVTYRATGALPLAAMTVRIFISVDMEGIGGGHTGGQHPQCTHE